MKGNTLLVWNEHIKEPKFPTSFCDYGWQMDDVSSPANHIRRSAHSNKMTGI